MSKLDGKVALITGGTSGIGAATARLFRSEGARVVVTGSNPRTLGAARAEMAGIDVVASDAGDAGAVEALVDEVTGRHGPIDVLFVNAGMSGFRPTESVDEQFFDQMFSLNVRGAFFLLKRAAAAMSDGGSIVLNASMSGVRGDPGNGVYAATKAALRSFGRTFANELAPRRIRVNTVSPGAIATPILGKMGLPKEQLDHILTDFVATVPLRRLGEPDEVARTVLFLASEDSSFITASELFVDGGVVSV